MRNVILSFKDESHPPEIFLADGYGLPDDDENCWIFRYTSNGQVVSERRFLKEMVLGWDWP